MATSNARECFSECIGRKVIGVLFDALPNRVNIAAGNKTLVFDDGSGLTFAPNGLYWRETSQDIRRAVRQRHAALAACNRELRDVLELAGRLDLDAEG